MGRPRGEPNPKAQQSWIPLVNHMLHESKPCHSQHKNAYKVQCGCPKHCAFVGVRSANCSDTALECNVCKGKGSQPEKMLYELLDAVDEVKLYAVESYSLVRSNSVCLEDGTMIYPNRKAWDVTILQPVGLLVEVQGEGHSSKLVTKRNNTDDSITDRQLKDRGYADAAVREGWSVLWLWVEGGCSDPRKRAAKWEAELKHALSYVKAGNKPQLFGS